MNIYEIRVIGSHGRATLSSQEMHLSDRAAISAGRRMCAGNAFEVWRDLDCIHRNAAFRRDTDAANENTLRP